MQICPAPIGMAFNLLNRQHLNAFHKFIATGFGSGYAPLAPGTAGAFVACLILYGLHFYWPISFSGAMSHSFGLILLTSIFFFLGVWSSRVLESEWGKDPSKIVVDEFVGIWVTMWFVPFNLVNLIIAFCLFRIFDIWKPLYIRKAEVLKNGWGVMVDDVLAGVLANIVLQLLLWLEIF